MRRGYRDDRETGDFPGERVFDSEVPIKYVLHPGTGRPDALAVGFSGMHPEDKQPRYYTHKAVSDMACHRVFVLDDHGPRTPLPRPCWYLGRHRRFDVADSVCDLLAALAEELEVERERTVTFGGSKGAWAALYFAARLGLGEAIAGEPQACLGAYLCGDPHLHFAEHIAGGASAEDREFLDAVLFDALRQAPAFPHVRLYCGREDRYHERHLEPLLDVLDEVGIPWELELDEWEEHVPNLGANFPGYLRRQLLRGLLSRDAAVRSGPPRRPVPAPS
jgi:hypothetical protein